jgi:NAD(P)-dependent dehydrogenase (short-subunit alcohol dehydrogenase family)
VVFCRDKRVVYGQSRAAHHSWHQYTEQRPGNHLLLPTQVDAKEVVLRTGRRALTLPTDLANEQETSATIERTVEEFGHIDVLVNTAGTDAPGLVEELPVEGWDRTLAVNLHAPFLLRKAAFPTCERLAAVRLSTSRR